MRSFGSLLLAGLVLTTHVAAQAGEAGVPPGLDARVAAEIAGRWGVPELSMRLAWGPVRDPSGLSDTVAFQLVGSGRGGQFAVGFHPDGARLSAAVRAGVVDTVAVAARHLTRGMVLAPGDLVWQEAVTWGPPGRAVPRPAAGWIVQRSIDEGQLLTPPGVSAPILVEAGAPVTLTWSSGAVQVAIEGTAAGSAPLGASVAVRVPGRPGRLRGTVTGPGTARLGS